MTDEFSIPFHAFDLFRILISILKKKKENQGFFHMKDILSTK